MASLNETNTPLGLPKLTIHFDCENYTLWGRLTLSALEAFEIESFITSDEIPTANILVQLDDKSSIEQQNLECLGRRRSN